MSQLAQGLTSLKQLILKLEDISIRHPVNSVDSIMEALELASLFEMYESTASSLLLQTSANLLERVKQFELSQEELDNLKQHLMSVGFTADEIAEILDLDTDEN
jgi:hypothetical protein